jgi:hypothetical protein
LAGQGLDSVSALVLDGITVIGIMIHGIGTGDGTIPIAIIRMVTLLCIIILIGIIVTIL